MALALGLRRAGRLICLALLLVLLAACSADDEPRIAFEGLDFAIADAGSGEKLFGQSNNEAPACSACHAVNGASSGSGNALAGIAHIAGQRVDGESAEEYLYWSILRPGRYLVAGYANVMYGKYESSLTAADLADLIVYLLTLG